MSSLDPSGGESAPGPAEPRWTLMRAVISSSLKFRYLVVAAAVGLMILGITSLPKMHVDVFPEFAPPRVVIQTACVGLSTSDVEQLVTVPLEAGLNGIQGLDDMRSKSVPQLSSIELLFKPGTDLLRARQLVQRPPRSRPPRRRRDRPLPLKGHRPRTPARSARTPAPISWSGIWRRDKRRRSLK